jgi:hypothetical protein
MPRNASEVTVDAVWPFLPAVWIRFILSIFNLPFRWAVAHADTEWMP